MTGGGSMIDAAMHWLGYGLCHQLPARSFFAGGLQLPVCARDTGIYIGFVVSILVMAALDRGRRRTGMPPAWILALGFAALVVMGWDGISSYAGFRATTNVIRLATGLGTGFALALVIVPLLNAQLWERTAADAVLSSPIEGVLWCASVPVTFAAVLLGAPLLGLAYPLLVASAIVATFTSVNLVVVLLVPRFERHATWLRDAWPAIMWALAATAVELAAAAWFRVWLLSLVSRG